MKTNHRESLKTKMTIMLVLMEFQQNLDAIPCRQIPETQITQEFQDWMARFCIGRRITYSTYL